MIPKRELSQEQIEEIRALRGRLSADEIKKRFGIGSTRLYKIWRDKSPQQPANPPPPPPYTERLALRRARLSKNSTEGWRD